MAKTKKIGKLSDVFGVTEKVVEDVYNRIVKDWHDPLLSVDKILRKNLKGLPKKEQKIALTFLLLGRRVETNQRIGDGCKSVIISTNDKGLADILKRQLSRLR